MATKSLSMGQYRMIGTISKLLRHTSSNRRICGSLTLAQICPGAHQKPNNYLYLNPLQNTTKIGLKGEK